MDSSQNILIIQNDINEADNTELSVLCIHWHTRLKGSLINTRLYYLWSSYEDFIVLLEYLNGKDSSTDIKYKKFIITLIITCFISNLSLPIYTPV